MANPFTATEQEALDAYERSIKTAALRVYVKEHYPHIKISVRSVSFEDLGRGSRLCLKVIGDQHSGELDDINNRARDP